jgi:2-polyprenyl-3-methyl-5-hydroxy-6-metoxy-1,4-benzoquinol methylase
MQLRLTSDILRPMNDDKISVNEAVDAALHLDGDPVKLGSYYDNWASSYEDDMAEVSYSGPQIGVKLLKEFQATGSEKLDFSARIIDAGCGTGLVGIALAELGYENIDGFDLSESMAQKARETKCYRRVLGNIDIMHAADTVAFQDYDALLCIGVFTLGHVPPQVMLPLVQLVRPGGLLVISTRNLYYDESDFQQVVDGLIDAGELTLLKVIKNAPYNKDGLAHYWVFRK